MTAHPGLFDSDEIRRTLAILTPAGVFEIRAPRAKLNGRHATAAGYFDDLETAARAAAKLSGSAPGIYCTLNPVSPALLARAANRIDPHAERTTGDADIAARRWMLLDFDPDRPAGVSSSDPEHAAALERAAQVRAWLAERGWPAPILADSGNGAHLLYRIELQNDDDAKTLVKGCLEALASRFDDSRVRIDTGVHNASRISKLYGTLACKGDSLPDRPHRLARILDAPEAPAPVDRGLLRALVPAPAPASRPTTPRPAGDFFAQVNARAMANLPGWVPVLFPAARPYHDGFRVASSDLGRALEEDLSIAPAGIVDFGVHDTGDPSAGKRTPIDLVIEHGRQPDAKEAALWLCRALGCDPATLGWKGTGAKPTPTGTAGIDAALLARCGIGPEPNQTPPQDAHAKGTTPNVWPAPIPLPEPSFTGAQPYPLENLPPALLQAVREIARFNQVPPASPALVGQSVLALAIGKQALVEERAGLEHHPALFFTGIADSGERKSPVVRHMTHPLEAWIQDKQAEYETRAVRVRANHQTIDSAISGLKKVAAKTGADLEQVEAEIAELEKKRLPLAIPPRMFTTDPTEQRLFQLMESHGGTFGVISGEGRPVFDSILGKYSGDGMNGDAIYLAGISGDTITRDRVGTIAGPESRYIARPCLNVAIMVQPDKYLEVARHPALRVGGAISRIWPVWLPSLVGSRIERPDDPPLNSDELQPYNKLVYDLLNAKRDLTAPHRAALSSDAADARREVHNEIEMMMQSGGDLSDVRDIASKAVSQMTKLALVYHLARDPGLLASHRSEIDLATWEAAQAVGIYHLEEAVRVQRLADGDDSMDEARSILQWLRREKLEQITIRKMMQYAPRPRPQSAKCAEAVMEILEEHHIARARFDANSRRASWDINPAVATVATVAKGDGEK